MNRIVFATIGVIVLSVISGCAEKTLPDDARLVLRDEDISRINRGMATDNFVFAIPTEAEGAPTTCRHAQVLYRDGGLVLKDMDSKNGTFLRVNEEQELRHGDYVFMGQQLLRVEIV